MSRLIAYMREQDLATRNAKVIEYIRSCETVLSLKFGAVDHTRRKREATFRRHAYCYVLCNLSIGNLNEVARCIGKALGIKPKDHATVMHSRDIAHDLIDCNDAVFMPIYEVIEEYFYTLASNGMLKNSEDETIKPFIDENFLV